MQDTYIHTAKAELRKWQYAMQKRPGIFNRITGGIQDRINAVIPEKFHVLITQTIKKND